METRAAMPVALALHGVEKSYARGLFRERTRVLAGIDLELERGASAGLVGPNGSGKSTLLRIAAGIEPPSAGQVQLFDASPDDARARARVGWLSDGSPYPLELPARSVLRLIAGLHGLPRAERRERCERMLARVGLERDARTPLRRFSQGMLRRFGLAQAFLHEPDLVLLDEPTAGLDAPGYAVLEELLAEARARGAALLVASHVLSDLREHCARVHVLLDGRIATSGTPGSLLGPRESLAELYRSLAGAASAPERRR